MRKIPFSLLLLSFCSSTSVAYAADNTGDDARLRLELARLQVYTSTNQLDAAEKLLTTLKQRHPYNADVLLAEADMNLQAGNKGAGLIALQAAQLADTENVEIMQRREEIRQPDTMLAAAGEYKSSKNLSMEHIARLSGQAKYGADYALGATFEHNTAQIRPITRANGTTARFEGKRERLTLNGVHVDQNGNEAKALLYATKKTLGIGGRYTWLDARGATEIQADLFSPDWNYLESIVGYGTRDGLRLSRTQFISPSLQGMIGGGANHYGLEGDRNVATTGAANAELHYLIPKSWGATGIQTLDSTRFSINYALDAEYKIDSDEKNGPTGRYRPFPLSSYEVHAANLSASMEMYDRLLLDAFGGYALDRMGGEGPQFGGFLTYAPEKGPQIQLYASRGISGTRDSDRSERAGINLAWKF